MFLTKQLLSFRGQIQPNTALNKALPHVVGVIQNDVNSDIALRKTAGLLLHCDLISNIYPKDRQQAFNKAYSFSNNSLNSNLMTILSKKNRTATVDKMLGDKISVDVAEKNGIKGIGISSKLLKYWKTLPDNINSKFLSELQEKFALTSDSMEKIKATIQKSLDLKENTHLQLRNNGEKKYIEMAKEVILRVKAEGSGQAQKIICEVAKKL
ncbi:MAG: hypothetical protein WCK67_13225 [bacterium]